MGTLLPPGLARACSAKYLAWQPSNDRDGGFPARGKIITCLSDASLLAGFVILFYLIFFSNFLFSTLVVVHIAGCCRKVGD